MVRAVLLVAYYMYQESTKSNLNYDNADVHIMPYWKEIITNNFSFRVTWYSGDINVLQKSSWLKHTSYIFATFMTSDTFRCCVYSIRAYIVKLADVQ